MLVNADALSRNPVPEVVVSSIVSVVVSSFVSVATDFADKQYADPDYKPLIDYLKERG